MKRVKIQEIADVTGLSRATIDRALNKRGRVHQRTSEIIDEAIRQLQASGQISAGPRLVSNAQALSNFDLVMRVGRGLMEQMRNVKRANSGTFEIHDLYQCDHDAMLACVQELCRDLARPLVITAKNTEALRDELSRARERGKRIIALVSDLSSDARDAFVGIDNKMAGQTAAFIIGNALRRTEARVGVVLGDYAFACHEDREIGFRTNLRTNFPSVQITDVVKGEDSPEQTYNAVRGLLAAHPDISALYNVAGGNQGLARAVQETGRSAEIFIVTHESNHVTAPLARQGLIDYLIAQNPFDLLRRVEEVLAQVSADRAKEINLVDFAVFTRFNLPTWEAAL